MLTDNINNLFFNGLKQFFKNLTNKSKMHFYNKESNKIIFNTPFKKI